MELNNEVYNLITKLSEQGDELADKEQFEAQKCLNGIGNPFICVRIGECFFEQNNDRKLDYEHNQ